LRNIQKLFLIVTSVFCIFMLHAEERNYMTRYLLSYPTTIEKEITSPAHWETKDWLTAGAVVVVGTGLYLEDEDINSWVQGHRSHFTHEAAKVGNVFGEGKYMFPAVGVLWLGSYVLGSEKTQDTGALMLKTMLIAGGTTTILKYASQRNRPNTGGGNEFWSESKFSLHNDSFPSGHATIAFSIATVLAEQYKSTVWVPIIAYSGATLTCYARVHDQKHWSSDVFGGTVIGYFTAQWVMKTTPRLYIAPTLDLSCICFEYGF
jgi:hypothetical protein